jgi:hypothetical protein
MRTAPELAVFMKRGIRFVFALFLIFLVQRVRAEQKMDSGCSTQKEVVLWLSAHAKEYRQKYLLSCEIALTRLTLGVMGIRDVTEDQILARIPRDSDDPERAFVCDDLNAGRRNGKGKILWNNYGTHPPVVVAMIQSWQKERKLSEKYTVRELRADDKKLRTLIRNDPSFLGAIVWVVGHPKRWGEHPPVNSRGMVLGEHVRFVEPFLADDAKFKIVDPETGLMFLSENAGSGRELFSYRVVGIFRD